MFRDRAEAGRRLAAYIGSLSGSSGSLSGRDFIILGLPRGGVPVAFEVARALRAPLDVIVVRKLGVPFQPELAMGAVGEGGVRVLDEDVLRATGIGPDDLDRVERRERALVEQRAATLRAGRAAVPLAGRDVLLVDDGIATGSTVRAACAVARARGADLVVVAVPVGPPGCAEVIGPAADQVVCMDQPWGFTAVGQAYRRFAQTTDDEVVELLRAAAGPIPPPGSRVAHRPIPPGG